ncbi:acetyl-CoA carboxylase biotin carboxyl carrier protein [Roseitranquillus sediminis]|uniref:acetyl-CoA carboxylase biotin carboxyl carrier protein n=1 Tax=Roseitranquillus sediminis TaxID=2809051 RepID=UPI001D0C2DF1|nr:acetyl-CoA carboxylase biotin carboxyl carrier protein [Roseitranquillus sediminis]MBM9595692.1 acetyl-CoA carboxylase biotin carboxyl carrier protein [Roseitranquillus sediminis]
MTRETHETDVAFIRALAELLRENDLTELQVKREYAEDDSLNVRVSRLTAPPPAAPPAPPVPIPAAPAISTPAPTAAAPAETEDPASHPGVVTSPMVGTAYLQAEPGSDAFVKIGDRVTEGQTLLIIEAMKTMNHIPSPRAGTVRRIMIEDGAPVEYGAPLMIVD